MSNNNFTQLLIDSAEQIDRKLGPQRIAQLKESYVFFKESGLNDDEVKVAMALTDHEIRLIKKS